MRRRGARAAGAEEGVDEESRRQAEDDFQPHDFQHEGEGGLGGDEDGEEFVGALGVPEIAGIVIGTRPDLIDEDILQHLKEIQQNHYVMLEYGVESVYNETLKRVNRGHDFATAERAIRMTADYGIPCGAHFIFGLPGETKTMMRDAANIISRLPLTTVKFHQLQIFKGTKMAEEYQAHPEHFHLFDLEEYIDFVIDFAERLNPDIVIERFAGEVPPRFLVSEPWMKLRYDEVLARIEKRMEERETWQGKLYHY